MIALLNAISKILYDVIYAPLGLVHYTHPIHPILVHLTIGTITAAFLFDYIGWIFRRDVLFTTARHNIIFAFYSFLVAGLTGLADWGHSYQVASLAKGADKVAFAFGMKYLLFPVLLAIFVGVYFAVRKAPPNSIARHLLYLACFVCALAFGFYGGNVVYG